MTALTRPLLLALFAACLVGQPKEHWQACPVIVKLPASIRASHSLDDSELFEIRQCHGEHIFVTAIERGAESPSLVISISGPTRFLAHILDVLVLQSMGGASDHVYVFAFRAGKPSLALKTATKDLIQVQQEQKAVVVLVPPATYPGPNGKFPPPPPLKRYSFPLEN